MKFDLNHPLFRRLGCGIFLFLLLLAGNREAAAQNYLLRYVNTDSGAITFVGNTLGLNKVLGANSPGNVGSIGAFTTLTGSTGGTYGTGTTLNWSNNFSSSVLRMPTNSTVLYAELIWAGTAQLTTNSVTPNSASNVLASLTLSNAVHFILPNGSSNNITPDPVTASYVTNVNGGVQQSIFYVRSADVTALVQAGGTGTYSVGGVPATIAANEDANNACGWTLAVVYENSSLHQRNLSLFVGNSFATAGGPPPNPVGVNGFCVPPTGPVNGFLFLSAIEGDPHTINDQMKFGTTTNNLAVLSGPNNPSNNFFASQINFCQPDNFNNLTNGTLDTTGTFGLSNSIPGTGVAGARQGWDITCVNVSSALTNGVTSAYAQNITTGDGYSVNALGLQIDVGSPVLATSQSVDKASTYIGDTLTYTVGVTNSGTADAVNLIFTDPLPFGTSFVANTFKTNGVTIVGANPVTGVPISIIKQNGNFSITYQVLVNQVPPSAKFVTAATIDFQFTGPCALSPIINATLVNLDVNTYIPLLAVNKVSSLTNVAPNALMTYAVNIPNSGSTNTVNSTLIDPIPAGVSYVTNTTTLNGISIPDINGTNMPFTVSREIHSPTRPSGQINAGETAVVTFQVRIDSAPPARIHNSATIFMNSNFPTSAQSADAYLPPVFTDLAAGISGNPNPVAAGSPFSLTITVTNKGPNAVGDATNFVTLSLPLDSSVLSPVYSPSVGSYNALNGVWSGITLPSNGVITLTVSGQVDPAANAGNLLSTVTVAPPPGVIDVNSTNNTARSTNAITQVADLALNISDGVSNVAPGTTLTYIITAVNLGPSTLNTISVSNFVSSFLTNVTFNPNQGTFNSFDGTWSGLNLAAGDSVALTLQGTVLTNVAGLFTNSSIAIVPPGVTDPVLANNSGSDVDIALPPTDVAVSKSAPANVFAGTNFNYTITVTNLGSVTASNVVVSDVLPVNVAFVTASGNGVNNSGTVTWSIGSLAPNGRSNLTLTVTAPATGSISNVATVTTTTPDTNPTNNLTPPVSTSVTPVANLAIGKTGPASIFAGINFSYTIAVTNFGPSTATSLTVTDSLPAGVVFVSSLPPTTTNAANQVIWANVTDLAAGAVTNLTLTVNAPSLGLLTNVASAGSPVIDTTPTNNISVPVVTAVTNRPPVVVNDIGSTPRNVPVTIPVLVNDSDPDGNPLTIITVTATNGTPVITGTNVVYTPGNTPGTNTIIYTVTDGNGGTNSGLITISVTNRPPVANNDVATTPINVPINVPVLANDSDPDGDVLTIVSVSPTNGTASISGTNVVFTPTNNLPGTVRYTITDGFGGTNSALVSVSVSNRPPVVVNDIGSTPRNVPVTIPALANDSDPDGNPLTIITVTATNGTPVIAGTNVVYTPGNTPGTNTIIYTVTDGNGGTNTGLITISVTNRPPVANNDVATTPINVPINVPVLANDSDPDGDVLTIVSVSPTNGTASISGTNVVFTPTNNLPGTVRYTITDGFGGTNSALVSVSVSNRPPVVVNDIGSTPRNVPVTIPVLANDNDPDGNPLTIITVTATNGTPVIAGTNVVYTPGNTPGTNTIIYTVTDGNGGTNSGLITISVTNRPPVANNDTATTPINVPVTIPVLTNDSDPDGDVLTIVSVSPTNGTASISGTNVVFTPTNNLPGAVRYTITDGFGGTNSALVSVSVSNRPPVVVNDIGSTPRNVPVTIPVLANDNDPDGNPLTIITVTATNGTPAISGTNVVYTPGNTPGTNTIIYTVTDGNGGTNTGLITISVTNRPPVANNDTATTPINVPINVPVLANDSDLDGDVLTIVSVSPTNGTASISGTNVVFTPTNNLPGTVRYTITDGFGGTNSALISVSVSNRPPVVVNDIGSTPRNVPVTIPVLANDNDPDGNPLTIITVSATNGTPVISGTNVVYTPPNVVGTNTIIYTVTDGNGGTNTGLITISVTNRPPVANNDTATTPINVSVNVPVLANDSDPDGDVLTIVSVSPTNGTASISGTNVVFTPTNNLPGTVRYTITDGFGGTNSALVTITVSNRPPVVVNDIGSTPRNVPVTIPVLANDNDPDGNPLTIITVTATNGTPVISGTNVVYTPGNTPSTNTIIYTVTDGNGGTNSGLITISVTNRPPVAGNDTATTPINVPINVPVLANDSDPDGDVLTIVSVSPTNGTASISGTNVVFTPTNNLPGVVLYTITDGFGGTNSALVTITATPVADLAIGMQLNSTAPSSSVVAFSPLVARGAAAVTASVNVLAGTNFDYIISVTNLGPSTASAVVVTDTLPVGVTFVGASGGGIKIGNQVVWSLGTMTVGQSSNLTLTVIPPSGGSLTNQASVSSSTFDPFLANNVTPLVVSPVTPSANVAVGKSGPAAIFAGTNYNYTIAVTNFGPSTATALSVTDNLPAGLIFVSASPATTTNAANQVIWANVTDLAAGAVTNLTLTVRAPARGGVTNTASGGSPVFDPAPANNFTPPVVTSITNRPPVANNDTATTPVNVPVTIPVLTNDNDPDGDPLTIVGVSPTNGTATISGTNVVFTPTNHLPGSVGYTVTDGSGGTNGAVITITVSNRPPVANNDTAVTPSNVPVTVPALANDTDPDGDALTIVTVSPTNGTAVISGANVVFTPGANFGGIATVGYQISDGNGGSSTALISISVTNPPVPTADIQVLLFGPTNVTVGDGFTYTIVVTNAGPSAATNTFVQDVLPTNLVFSAATAGGVVSNSVVTWPIFPVLLNGQATNLTVTVTPGAFGSTNLIQTNNPNPFNYVQTNSTAFFGFLTNVVSAFASTFDPNLTNNTGTLSPLASVQTQIVPGVFSIFIATNGYPTNLSGLVTNTIIPIGNNLFIVGTSAFNPQTGLYEENVTVTNLGTTVVHALRLYIGGLRPGVSIYNVSGTNNGVPYVEYRPPFSSPLQPFPAAGNSVTFQLEFFVADRHPFTNSLTAEAILTASAGITNGVSVPVSQQFTDFRTANGRFVLGFNSIPGRTYTILYGDSIGTITNIAVPSIVASANATQWYDDGPPKTLSKPTSVGSRFYQVILNP